MKKFLIWIGLVPAWVKKYTPDAIKVTDILLRGLDSDFAKIVIDIVPGDVDEAARELLIKKLTKFKSNIAAISDDESQKAIVLRAGAELLKKIDGDKERIGYYIFLMEAIYQRTLGKQTAN